MLDLYKLDIFLQVVRAGSFNRAAEGLLMSQSAVSQHIQDLEVGLGSVLFERGRRGVRLTKAGDALHGYAVRIFALLAEAENAVTDVGKLSSGQLTIGATPGVGGYLLPDAILGFRQQFPKLSVVLQTGITPQIITELRLGRLALGFIEGEITAADEPDLAIYPLEAVEQFVVVGPNHPWWGRTQVAIGELQGQSFIMRQAGSRSRLWLEQKLRDYQIEPLIRGEFDNVESIKRMASLGTCVAILPLYVVENEVERKVVQALPLVDAPLQRTLRLIWLQETFFNPIARAFLQHLSVQLPALAALEGVHRLPAQQA
ncbi:MAG: LysR family transcriptional regulator [Caldilineaceae bacterium]|nr:LysR family transcriptional regulator [Caldilineaceae bacterium]